MKYISIVLLSVLAMGFTILGQAEDFGLPYGVISSTGEACKLNITVKDANTERPIEGATVLLGMEVGANNMNLTDSSGNVQFSSDVVCGEEDASSSSKLQMPVTVVKEKYHHLTLQEEKKSSRILNFLSNLIGVHQNVQSNLTIYLHPETALQETPILKGTMSPFPTGIPSNRVEVGIFLPSFNAETLLRFNRQHLMSNKTDAIPVPVVDSVDLPSNIMLPKQKKSYFGFSIPLDKPNFTFPMGERGEGFLCGIAASVDIPSVIDASRSENYLAAIGAATVTNVGCSSYSNVDGNMEGLHIDLREDLLDKKLQATYQEAPGAADIVFASLFDPGTGTSNAGKSLALADIKVSQKKHSIHTAKAKLSTLKSSDMDSYVVAIATDQAKLTHSHQRSFWYTATIAKAGRKASGRRTRSTAKAQLQGHLGRIELTSISEDYRNYSFTLGKGLRAGETLEPDYIFVQIVAEKAGKNKTHRKLIWANLLPPDSRTARLPKIEDEPLIPSDTKHNYFIEIIAVKVKYKSPDRMETRLTIENLSHVSYTKERF